MRLSFKYVCSLPLDLYIKKKEILIHLSSFKCLISWEVWVPTRMKLSNGNVKRYGNILFLVKHF